eukprot:5250400-Amphidinium_carterae.1
MNLQSISYILEGCQPFIVLSRTKGFSNKGGCLTRNCTLSEAPRGRIWMHVLSLNTNVCTGRRVGLAVLRFLHKSKRFVLVITSRLQENFIARNSILSEYGVLGFETGYSYENPHTLNIWEA